ncbi:MAG: hypothetical protein CVU84_12815 [Firmicutes bacterium HGW-Firmicutes-1]|jgi:diguanylate cyclase (GGDEF)-like protein/putative nucleotidyltransferase with HDIG domain|nr:MAG: hypothetical protein CVU84_12815 [Firmicutes bacterium HGW-Firmicutes-1]
MYKKAFYIYINLILLLVITVLFTYIFIRSEFSAQNDEILILDQFKVNGVEDELKYRNLTQESEKFNVIETTFEKSELENINGSLELLIPKLSANWYKVKMNDVLIGSVGNDKTNASSIWNAIHTFTFDKSQIKDLNTVTIEAYSDYKFGKSVLPIVITNSESSYKIIMFLRLFLTDFNYVLLGILFAISLYILFLMSTTTELRNFERLIPVGVLLLSINILDYTPIYYMPFSLLTFRKLVFLCLYLATACISFGFSYAYKKKLLKILGILLVLSILIAIVFSPDMITFKKFYVWINLGLMVNVIGWIIVALQDIKTNKYQSLLISVAGFSVIVPGIYEIILLILGIDPVLKISIYGMLSCAVGLLILSFYKYFNYQKNIYTQSILLEKEKELLGKTLITDELTNMYNHRYFHEQYSKIIENTNNSFSLLYIDIDKFTLINEKFGYSIGDEVIKEISCILQSKFTDKLKLFRYVGDNFIAIMDSTEEEEIIRFADSIRLPVIESETLKKCAGFFPATISIGISRFPEDAFDLRMLIYCSEKAARFAKMTGGNKVNLFNTSLISLMDQEKDSIKKGMLTDFVCTFASAIDLKDCYTGKHSEEVCRLSMLIAEKLGLNENEKHDLMIGGMLHDIGKLGVPDSIILKDGPLNNEEYSIIKNHPIYGYDMIKQFIQDKKMLSCIRSHHERYDGRGYPDRLSGTEIPLLARIITVADSYHAMVSNRPYRKSLSKEIAILELIKNKGTQFDPKIVDIMVEAVLIEPRVEQVG